jgi:hypothetical protein
MLEMLNGYNCFPSTIMAANEDIFNGSPASDVVSMKEYREIIFIITKSDGAVGTATLTVESCDTVVPGTATAVAFQYKVCTSGNTWGATTAATAAGFTTTAGINQMYMISIRADQLSGTDKFVRLQITEVDSTACDGAAICIGIPRYAQDIMPDMTS